ncbi:UDP-N-acetylglucosamine diphosphorylase [Patescibacteria group bacterium]|nr:UDP-N-acetylglucosamine diphosphorylase [Patescibacteria group bacterium]MBU1673482.1 UDP-N-acetylglucosamine diphosphorylase [Patescibacteria group bacterium]MBU1964001.1 UDP-N-acetylglucosamine diphosphorylase [Patescibacteria group bacterium]
MFNIEDYFNLEYTEHKELFQEIKHPWEVIPKIAPYLENKIGKEVHIGEGTVVEEGAVIKGPAYIGKNCEIRTGAYLRGNVIVGDGSVIGNSTELKNCLIFNKAEIPHFNYVGDSILGYKAHLGAGAIISNVTIPMREIKVRTPEKEYATGLQKFGAIIGDNTEIGSNSVINPGSMIGRNCLIYPLVSWRGVLGDDLIVKLRQQQEVVVKK